MAPTLPRGKKLIVPSKKNPDTSDKENIYFRRLTDYQTRVRRRDTVRNIRNNTERDLESKIGLEIQIRDGSAKLLAASRHRTQSLEAARALFVSNERMSMYLRELQRRKKNSSEILKSLDNTATIYLSDLRFPLMWKDLDHFKNRGDYRRFAVFFLARVGTEMCESGLICPIDRTHTDITFNEPLIINKVPAEFELQLEIYSCMLEEDFSIASTPLKITKTIHSSISKTIGKKLSASLYRDINHSGQSGPRFVLAASAKLTSEEIDNAIQTHDLVINHVENKQSMLPLFGHFCCRLAVEPQCINSDIYKGTISINGKKYWAVLRNFYLKIWSSKELADEEENVINTIPINKETIIQLSKQSSRKLLITNFVDNSKKTVTIGLETNNEALEWSKYLTAHSKDHSRWKAVRTIERVYSPDSIITPWNNFKHESLYDQTSLLESIPTGVSSTHKFSVQEISRMLPSMSLSNGTSNTSNPQIRSLRNNSMYKLSSVGAKCRRSFLNKT